MSSSLQSRLPQIAAELLPRVSAAVTAAAEVVAEDARNRVPVGPPDVHIRDHITVQRTGWAESTVFAGDGATFYGHMIEHGTTHSPPHPFLVPALEANAGQAIALVAAALKTL